MKKAFLILSLTLMAATGLQAGNYYVKASGGSDSNPGATWGTAYATLQKALTVAASGDVIYVAKGTYKPSRAANGTSTNDRDKAFVLVSGVKIYGGFAGRELVINAAALAARDFTANATILSGDIGTEGDNSDNCYHVVVGENIAVASGTVLDGFTITGGNADGSGGIYVNSSYLFRDYGGGICNSSSSPTLTNVTINGNTANDYGGGIYNSSSSPTLTNVTISENTAINGGGICNRDNASPTLTNVTISGNTANQRGGGIYNATSSPTLTNTIISGNTANDGGGIYNASSSPTLTNISVSGNTANNGGGISNFYNSSPKLRNSIVWGNSSSLYFSGGNTPNYSYSLVQGLGADAGTGMLDGTDTGNDPLFVSPQAAGLSTAGDYRLQAGSPAIDTGNSALFNTGGNPDLSHISTDRDGNPRKVGLAEDMGAYEFQGVNRPSALYVKAGSTGTGTSFANALASLDVALARAKSNGIDKIYVAAGTYTPSLAADGTSAFARNRAFVIHAGMKIYGGFSGNGTTVNAAALAARDFTTNATVLNGAVNATDSVYHVVVAVTTADADSIRIDGFTITAGSAAGTGSITVSGQSIPQKAGGGLYVIANKGTVQLSNNSIHGNRGGEGGGIYALAGNANSLVSLSGNTVSGNSANEGGGIFSKANLVGSSVLISNNSFSNNTSATNAGGVLVHASTGSTTVTHNTITDNSAVAMGGGIYGLSSNVGSAINISQNTISNNNANTGGGTRLVATNGASQLTGNSIANNTASGGGGGGVFAWAENNVTMTISGNRFSGNRTTSSEGGGIYATSRNAGSTINIDNNIFSGNISSSNGGGAVPYARYGLVSMTNNLFTGNTAGGVGGGIYTTTYSSGCVVKLTNNSLSNNSSASGGGVSVGTTAAGSTVGLFNNIAWGNSSGGSLSNLNAATGSNGTVTLANNLLGEAAFADITGNARITQTAGSNLFGSDPLFVDAAAGNYRLYFASPAIDAGNNSLIPVGITTDLNGNARIENTTVDMGAYERASSTFYVKAFGGSDSNSGTSFGMAYASLQKALTVAEAGDVICVAQGTYKPSARAGNGSTDRDMAFVLKSGVQIFGGFAGTETNISAAILAARNFGLNPTILSGDIGTADDNADNCYHVVIGAGIANDGQTVLDGFTITGGNANIGGGGISVNNQYLHQESGGGINNVASSPVLTNIVFRDNTANYGGGIANASSSPTLTNVTLSGNTANQRGGGIYNTDSSSPTLTNVTLSGNTAGYGGGISNTIYSSPMLTNVTISGNRADNGGGIYNNDSSPKLRNSLVWGNGTNVSGMGTEYAYSLVQGIGTDAGTGMLDGTDPANDPLFVAPQAAGLSTAGDYRLQAGSPAINAGNNALFNTGVIPDLSHITTDLDGNPRIIGGTVDLGAYEKTLPAAYYVKADGSDSNSGASFGTAFASLQNALEATKPYNGDSIFVAAGTYKPSRAADGTSTNARDKAFVLVQGVKVYGGFAGTETNINAATLAARNFGLNPTILSGDIGTVGNNSDYCYHVVIGAGIANDGQTVLDGFTITGGNASGGGSITVNSQTLNRTLGGGIANYASSPVLTHITLSGNSTNNFGGGIYNTNSSPTLTNVTISGNTADNGGGIANYDSSSPVLTNVIISGNTAGNGGGILNDASSPTLTNVTISGNTADYGGGIANYSSSPKLRNSIVWSNSSGVHGGGTEYSYSLVQGVTSNDANGNIDGNTDPLFVAPQAAGLSTAGDYRLQAGSPAIDAGNNALYNTGAIPDLSHISTDRDGNVRIYGGTVDLGAYEYIGSIVTDNEPTRGTTTGDVVVYPNPATTTLYIDAPSEQPTVKLYSLAGTLLQQSIGTSVDVSGLVPGVYVLDIDGAKVKVVKR